MRVNSGSYLLLVLAPALGFSPYSQAPLKVPLLACRTARAVGGEGAGIWDTAHTRPGVKKGRGVDSPPKHLDIFQGAPLELPKPLSDQFPLRVCSCPHCIINRL